MKKHAKDFENEVRRILDLPPKARSSRSERREQDLAAARWFLAERERLEIWRRLDAADK